MAVTRSLAQLAADLRLGDGSTVPTGAQGIVLARIDSAARAMVLAFAPGAPDPIHNEAFSRVAGWLYDSDPTGATPGGPNALRSSGAAAILGRYRIRRAGVIGGEVAAAVASTDAGNPVTDVTVSGSSLTVTYADGTVAIRELPSGGTPGEGVGVDQGARDAAATAQARADLAVLNAATAQATADGKTSPADVAALILAAGSPEVWAQVGNLDLIPLAKLGAHLNPDTVQMLIAWKDVDGFGAPTWSDNELLAGSVGDNSGTAVPDYSGSSSTSYLGIWVAAPLDRLISYYRGLDLLNVGAHQRIVRSVNGVSGVLYHPGNRQPVSMAGTVWRVTLSPGTLADAIVHQIEAEVEDWARAGDPHPIPTDKLTLAPSGNGGTGIAIGDVKAFARTGVTTPPGPADLAPSPMSGRVLGLRTAGGQLQTSWNQLSAGSPHFVLDTIPTPEQQAIGGLLPQGGVVLVRETDNHPTQLWVRISPAFALVLFHTFADPIVEPGADGHLPTAADFPGRLGLAGNHFFASVNAGGHDKQVTFRDYGPTRPEPPTRSAQELLYGGSVADPPHNTIGNYVVNTILWDRGSEVWIIKATSDATRWSTYSGPLGYHQGRLYQTDGDAAVHVTAGEIGDIYIIGHGSGQRPRIVTAYSAPTADDWRWIPIGLTIQDVADQVAAHNESSTAHPDIRALVPAAVAGHNAAGDAHPDIRALDSRDSSGQRIDDLRLLFIGYLCPGIKQFFCYPWGGAVRLHIGD